MQKIVSLAALLHGRTFTFSDGLRDIAIFNLFGLNGTSNHNTNPRIQYRLT